MMPKQRSAVKQDLQVFNAAAAATACNFNAAVRVLNLESMADKSKRDKDRHSDREKMTECQMEKHVYIRLNWLPNQKKEKNNFFIEVITIRFVLCRVHACAMCMYSLRSILF